MRLLSPSLLLATALSALSAAAEPPTELKLVPESVAGEAGSTWDGPQVVRADRVGNVFLLRISTLEVYPLTQTGKLGEPSKLELLGEAPQLVRDAALGPGGDVWLLSTDLVIRRFVNGKEKVISALDWRVSGIGFERSDPVVSILPLPVIWDRAFRERKGQIPRLMTFDGNRWNVLAEYSDLPASDFAEKRPDLNDALSQHAVLVAADREGRLWIARQYAYDIEQITSSGKQRLRLVVNGGKVTERAEDAGTKNQSVGLKVFRSNTAILDLVEGRDRRMYFLATEGGTGGLVLDRYDPVTSELQRVPLMLELPGRVTIAAGKNGLYLAAWNGRNGRWLLSWDTLELAAWRPVPNAEISPAPIPDLPASKPAHY